ncbi:hypothetical protein D3C87_254190 [compost metagenome]
MAKTLKVGFLCPYSGIYPNYAQHMMGGFLLGMGLDPAIQEQIHFIPAYTNMGGVTSTLEAAKKMLFFDRVDILSGLISFHSLPELKVLMEGKQTIPFFFNLGENLLQQSTLSKEIFINSQFNWKSQFALGKWAQKEFGGTGICVTPFYESGYHLFSAFKKGTEAAGGLQIGLSVLPQSPDSSSYIDFKPFFESVSTEQPSFVHAIFCGKAGNEFLKAWFDQDFSQHIPLVTVENMAYEDMLEDLSNLNIKLYAASSWSRTSELPENTAFVNLFESKLGQKANIFGLMGYESGLAMKQIQPYLEKADLSSARHFLENGKIYGPRAERSFNPWQHQSSTIDVLSIKTTNTNIHQTIIAQEKSADQNSSLFQDITSDILTGWQNPYMCI